MTCLIWHCLRLTKSIHTETMITQAMIDGLNAKIRTEKHKIWKLLENENNIYLSFWRNCDYDNYESANAEGATYACPCEVEDTPSYISSVVHVTTALQCIGFNPEDMSVTVFIDSLRRNTFKLTEAF